ncbi:hypothetical protein ACGK9U_12020, partial [Mariniflexile sp. HNIBRBA6329]|uniref:hypothetical protein n=1 Tax=Mariniflexile sp. HNIBRBA6329 TaxID=3373088 RepID=UPI0037470328
MKKNYFTKILCILYLLLISINIAHARNLSGTPTPTTPIHNIQYKVISFFADLFSDNQVSKIDKTKRYNKSLSNYKLTSSSTSFALAAVADVAGDFRSTGNGNWTNSGSWEVFNGAAWLPTLSYPGQNTVGPPYPNVTIVSGHNITIATNLNTQLMGTVTVNGTLTLNISASPNNAIITTPTINVDGGTINFTGSKARLTLPDPDPGYDPVITLSNGGTLTAAICNNNNEIFIGSRKYAACAGAPGSTYTFGEVNAAGGTVNATISNPATGPITICFGSQTLEGGYLGPDTYVTYTWTARNYDTGALLPSSVFSIPHTGTLPTNASTTNTTFTPPATLSPPASDQFLISLEIKSGSFINVESRIINIQAVPSAGTISGVQTICDGGDPAAFTSTVGTGSGTITYRWESATSPFSTWNTIGGATAATYDAPSGLNATTQYRRTTISTLNGVACESNPTATIQVTVQAVPTPGSIGSNQTICNGTAPALLTSTTTGTGSGSITYQWQTNASGSYIDIPSANAATYQPPSLTNTTSYRRRTVSTLNSIACNSAPTAPVVITVGDTTNPTASNPAPINVQCLASVPAPDV